jgi:haloalkane dehalogenase
MDWVRRHPDATRGVVCFETTGRPRNWGEISPAERNFFERLCSRERKRMVLQDSLPVQNLLPDRILRPPSEAEMTMC